MNIIQTIKETWAWCGLEPDEVVAVNDFANLIIRGADEKFWRLCPEDVYCEVVADSAAVYEELIKDKDFIRDWNMSALVDEATELLGDLAEGEYYCLILPGVFDGEYGGANLRKAPLLDIIKYSGDLGKKIKDLPDGAEITHVEFK